MKPAEIMVMCSDEDNSLNHIEVICKDCNKEVSLSDSTMQTIRLKYPDRDLVLYPPTIVCKECFFESYYNPSQIQPLSEIQIKDISDSLK